MTLHARARINTKKNSSFFRDHNTFISLSFPSLSFLISTAPRFLFPSLFFYHRITSAPPPLPSPVGHRRRRQVFPFVPRVMWRLGWQWGHETDHHHYHQATQHDSQHHQHSSVFTYDKNRDDNYDDDDDDDSDHNWTDVDDDDDDYHEMENHSGGYPARHV